MANMYDAATSGLVRGAQFAGMLDQAKRNKSRDKYIEEMRDIELAMGNMKLDNLKDETTRSRVKRDLKTSLWHLENMKNRGPEYVKQLQGDPETLERVRNGMKGFGSFVANRGQEDGLVREFKDLRRVGEDDDGNPLLTVDVDVYRQDGSKYTSQITNNRSADPDDKVRVFTEEELFNDMAQIEGLIDMYESALINVGDDYPFEKRSAANASKAKIADREDKQKHELQKAAISASRGGGAKQGDIQLMEYFINNGLAENQEEAYSRVQTLKTNPTKEILSIAKALQKSDSENPLSSEKPFEDYVRQAEGEVTRLMGRMAGETSGIDTPSPSIDAGQEVGDSVQLPEDIPPPEKRRTNATYMIKGKPYIWHEGKGWKPLNAQSSVGASNAF